MEKRVLLAVVLSFVVLYSYQVLFPPPKPAANGTTATAPGTTSPSSAAATSPEANAAEAAEPAPAAPEEAPVVGERAERDIVVENSAVRAVFTNRGGVIKSWTLKNYKGDDGQP